MINEQITQTGFLRLPEVLKLFPVSRSSWFAGIKEGKYPKSCNLGPRTSAWRMKDIHALIESFDVEDVNNG